jgi:NAD(P)-dependent dehydrogenase (short-subunit alcohol dehydrogenase family)
VMVNNAGIFRGAPLLDLDADALDTVYGVNVRGVFAGCKAAAADMRERDGGGAIVNTASISSTVAQSHHAAYDASKAAVMMLTRVCALELAQSDVRVNAVAPGAIRTGIGSGNDIEATTEVTDGDVSAPMGRAADPEEVAGAYLYLASEDASYVTGHMLTVDGGYTII